MRGRKPTFNTLSAAAKKDVPKAPVKVPSMPATLTGEAAAEWKRLTTLLKTLGIVASLDRTTLAMHCMAWQRWTEAEAALAAQGVVVKSPNGYPIQNPFLSVSTQAAKQMQILLSEFGLSPSARHRMLGAAQKKEKTTATGWEGKFANVG